MRTVRRTRQKLLRPGMAFTLVAVSVLLAAVNTGTNLLYLVAGGLVSFLVLSLWLSRWSLRRVMVSREAPGAVYRGEEFGVGLRIENRKLLIPAVSLRFESGSNPGVSAGYVIALPPRRAALTHMMDILPKRGIHTLPDLTVATTFPFGLIEARRVLRDAVDVLVYPRVHPVGSAVIEQVLSSGEMPKSVSAEGDEFFSLREYVRGDDVRRIAWRPSARKGRLLVKEMEADSARTITLLLDTLRTDDPAFEEHFEAAVEAAASLAVALLRRRYSVGLATPSRHVAEGEGSGQARRILEALARVQPEAATSAEPQAFPIAGRRYGGACVALTGDWNQWGSWNRGLSTRVLDPREVVRD